MKWVNIFEKFKNNKILIVGDVMLDTYLIGKVDRISPEAPVPVVDINERINKLGGAANVALNIKELGATPILCSITGNDKKSSEINYLLTKNGITSKYIYKDKNRTTTNKTRIMGNNFQILRVDEETVLDINDYVYEKLKDNIIISVAENNINGIIFQDYDKGVINKKLIDYIIRLSEKRNIPLFVDPKYKNFEYYKKIKIFKPNFNELKKGLNNEKYSIENWEKIKPDINNLIKNKKIDIFYTTLGDKGILVSYEENNDIKHHHIKSEKRNVADVSGAGDTVISVASLLTINNVNIIDTAKISNMAGGIVCEKIGVVPINKEELLENIKI